MKYVDKSAIIKCKDRQIKICNGILSAMSCYIQKTKDSFEAGGVLIGRENLSDNNLIIEYATEPMINDKRSRNRFYRKDNGHIDFYTNLYNRNHGVYTYVGEWHTHPEDFPNPSIIDLNNWKKLAKDSNCNIKHIHIIVGCKAIKLWEVSYSDKKVIELATLFWEDVNLS